MHRGNHVYYVDMALIECLTAALYLAMCRKRTAGHQAMAMGMIDAPQPHLRGRPEVWTL